MSTNLLFSILIHYPLKKGKTTTLNPGKERSSEISRILRIVQFLCQCICSSVVVDILCITVSVTEDIFPVFFSFLIFPF